MTRFKPSKLSTKIIVSVILAVAFSILAVTTGLSIFSYSIIKKRIINDLNIHAEIIGSNCQASLLFDDKKAATKILSSLKAVPTIENSVLYDSNGKEFAFYVKKGSIYIPFNLLNTESGDYIVIRHDITTNNEHIGTLYIRSNLNQLYFQIKWIILMMFLIILLSSIISFIIISYFIKKSFKPMEILLSTMNEIADKKDYSIRADIISDDEFGDITQKFNNMVAQIKIRDDKIKEYQAHLESEVERRMQELNETNKKLKNEILEIQRMEEMIAKSATEWRTTFDSIKDPVFLLDEKGLIQRCNRAASEILGLSYNKIVGNNICIIGHNKLQCDCKIEEVMKNRSRVLSNIKIGDKTYSVVYDPIVSSEKLTGIVHIMADITKQIELEENIRQIQKMEAVGRLAGGVAHDFNNLLSIITLYTDSLSKRLKDVPHVSNEISEIKKAIERATNLSRQLLMFSRKQILNPTIFDLNEILRSNHKMLSRLIGENIKIDLELTQEKIQIMADVSQFENAIMNMVINSKDAMPQGGKIKIITERKRLKEGDISISEFLNRDMLILKIIDNGEGMSEDIQKKIFEPFFTTKPKGKGTGLGLAMVYGFVKQCNGHIEVNSKVGEGTEFRIYLPLTEKTEEIKEVTGLIKIISSENINILLVEDDLDVRKSIIKMLSDNKFSVTEADSAIKALDIIQNKNNKIDFILSDIIMPQMDGITFSKKVRELDDKVPILFMTGYSDEFLPKDDIEKYKDMILEKPFTESQLLNKIHKMML